jgi:hypothetical protein
MPKEKGNPVSTISQVETKKEGQDQGLTDPKQNNQ